MHVIGCGQQLVVGTNGVALVDAVQVALCLIDVGGGQRCAQILQREAVSGQCNGVRLDTHAGLLAAGNRDETDARELRYFVGQYGVGEILNLGERQRG